VTLNAQQPGETLRLFLERRERELTHQIAALRGQIATKERELAEIQAVRATLAPSAPAPAGQAPPVPDTSTFEAAAFDQIRAAAENRHAAAVAHPMQQSVLIGGVPQKRTIKSMILTALTSHFDDGATLTELRTFIKDVFGLEIDRTSISPQLARLREEGAVEQGGGKWRLTEPASQRGITNNSSPQKSEDT
jgi:hypothetical protein